MSAWFTDYICDVCGKSKGVGNHAACSKVRQKKHADDKRHHAAKKLSAKKIESIIDNIRFMENL